MKFLTEVNLDWGFEAPFDVQRLTDLTRWLQERKADGYTIIADSSLGFDPKSPARLGLRYRARLRFVDRSLAVMCKVAFG